jgi:hypothetical protein
LAKAFNSTALKTVLPSFPDAMLRPKGRYSHLAPVGIGRPLTIIGASDHVHIRLRSRTISPVHAMLLNVDGHIVLRDLCSNEGVTVNRKQVRSAILRDGDVIRIGRIRFAVTFGSKSDEPAMKGAPAARLWNHEAEAVPLNSPTFVLGSDAGADLVLPAEAPAAHAVIFSIGSHRFVRNLCPDVPLRLNNTAVHQAVLIAGDRVETHGHCFQYDLAPTPKPRPAKRTPAVAVATMGMQVATDIAGAAVGLTNSTMPAEPTLSSPEEGESDLSDPFMDLRGDPDQPPQPSIDREELAIQKATAVELPGSAGSTCLGQTQEFEQERTEHAEKTPPTSFSSSTVSSNAVEGATSSRNRQEQPSTAPADLVEETRIKSAESAQSMAVTSSCDDSIDLAIDPNPSEQVQIFANMRALGPLAAALLTYGHDQPDQPAPAQMIQASQITTSKSRALQRAAIAVLVLGAIGAGLWWGILHRALM